MSEKIAFIGLGKMGLPMAKNLLKNGHTIFGMDVNQSAVSEFQSSGGKTKKMKDWMPEVNYIILMLPSSKIVNQVIDEIIDTYEPDKREHPEPLTIIDMSSSYPSDTRLNKRKLEEKNLKLIDAPVSGGVKKAVSAELTVMGGGAPDDFENCKRLLSAVGTNIYHVGPIGSGHLIKAINNYLSATHLLASCEAIQLLAAFEVSPETAIEVINQSTGRSASTEYKFPAFILSESYTSGFSLDLMRKDVEMASQIFSDAEASTALPQVVFQKFKEAAAALEGDPDHTEIYQYVKAYLFGYVKQNCG